MLYVCCVSDFIKAREIWLDNPLMYVDVDTIESLCNEYYKTIIKCVRTFHDMPKVQYVATTIRVRTYLLPQHTVFPKSLVGCTLFIAFFYVLGQLRKSSNAASRLQ